MKIYEIAKKYGFKDREMVNLLFKLKVFSKDSEIDSFSNLSIDNILLIDNYFNNKKKSGVNTKKSLSKNISTGSMDGNSSKNDDSNIVVRKVAVSNNKDIASDFKLVKRVVVKKSTPKKLRLLKKPVIKISKKTNIDEDVVCNKTKPADTNNDRPVNIANDIKYNSPKKPDVLVKDKLSAKIKDTKPVYNKKDIPVIEKALSKLNIVKKPSNHKPKKKDFNENSIKVVAEEIKNLASSMSVKRLVKSGEDSKGGGVNDKSYSFNSTKKPLKHKPSSYTKYSKVKEGKKLNSKFLSSVPGEIFVLNKITISDLSKKVNIKSYILLKSAKGLGLSVNSVYSELEYKDVQIIMSGYNCDVKLVSAHDGTRAADVVKNKIKSKLKSRVPVVSIMGHVNHGKTTLVDILRKSNITKGEFGAITQHLGSYSVEYKDKFITFIDTPGHKAFHSIRSRGTNIADILVLVVAANDGVKPQTLEVINLIKQFQVKVIVAISKIDVIGANVSVVKEQLSTNGILVEDWGGDVQCVEISALKNQNIDSLLEAILLESDLLELEADFAGYPSGVVLESKFQKGLGYVSTLLIQSGILKKGDIIVSGESYGRVRSITNDRGKSIATAVPSLPVQVTGVSGSLEVADRFDVVGSDKEAKKLVENRKFLSKEMAHQDSNQRSLEHILNIGNISDNLVCVNIIVKCDTGGSIKAVTESIESISNEKANVKVLYSNVGEVNDNDINFASASNGFIVAFNTSVSSKTKALASKLNISIYNFKTIYDLIDEVTLLVKRSYGDIFERENIGRLRIKTLFNISKVGDIAGSVIESGIVEKGSLVSLVGEEGEEYETKVLAIKRFKENVSSVSAGNECGIKLKDITKYKEGDLLDVFKLVKQ